MKVVPLNDKVLVKRLDAEVQTKGGILLPSSAQEKPRQGKIIAVGTGKALEGGKRAAAQVKIGDTVLFTSWAGNEIKVENEEYLLMTEDDILAILA